MTAIAAQKTMGVFKLKDALEPLLEHYERVLIDCPPNVGELTVSALLVADEIVCGARREAAPPSPTSPSGAVTAEPPRELRGAAVEPSSARSTAP
ncbi:MAG: ParA family protein [Solirubrobacteraceae bacterium]